MHITPPSSYIPYTFRAENDFLPVDYQSTAVPTDYGRAIDEQVTYLRAGLDGLFTDQATSVSSLAQSSAPLPQPEGKALRGHRSRAIGTEYEN
jgi:glycerophosphoryl diester phosphodiesterase